MKAREQALLALMMAHSIPVPELLPLDAYSHATADTAASHGAASYHADSSSASSSASADETGMYTGCCSVGSASPQPSCASEGGDDLHDGTPLSHVSACACQECLAYFAPWAPS